jgi:predicted lipoprotein with Yx(FWY)xxD motif
MRFRVPAALTLAVMATLGLTACGDDDQTDATATTTAPAAGAETTTTAADATTTTAAGSDEAPAGDAVVAIGDTALGAILVDSEGMTLYLFENDTDGVSTCSGGCADTWPALVADGTPTAGDGVDAGLLGTAARDDGSMQVTYNGHPLYHFAPDEAPGDTNGQEIGDVWYVVDAGGNALES